MVSTKSGAISAMGVGYYDLSETLRYGPVRTSADSELHLFGVRWGCTTHVCPRASKNSP